MGDGGVVSPSWIQNHKPTNNTNLHDLLYTLIPVHASSSVSSPSSGFPNLNTADKRTMNNVIWSDIVAQDQTSFIDSFLVGNTTLRDFLHPTPMVSHLTEWVPPQGHGHAMAVDSSFCIAESSKGAKRQCSDEMTQKTSEGKLQRMIKNRESAARSRVRKQAYTNQLELEVKDLRETNKWLKKQKEIEMKLSLEANMEIKYQLRRTISALI